jgi:hypothetical protein
MYHSQVRGKFFENVYCSFDTRRATSGALIEIRRKKKRLYFTVAIDASLIFMPS